MAGVGAPPGHPLCAAVLVAPASMLTWGQHNRRLDHLMWLLPLLLLVLIQRLLLLAALSLVVACLLQRPALQRSVQCPVLWLS